MTAGPGKSQQVGLKTTSTWLKTANTDGSASAILAWKGLNLGPTLAKRGSWAQEDHRHSASPGHQHGPNLAPNTAPTCPRLLQQASTWSILASTWAVAENAVFHSFLEQPLAAHLAPKLAQHTSSLHMAPRCLHIALHALNLAHTLPQHSPPRAPHGP